MAAIRELLRSMVIYRRVGPADPVTITDAYPANIRALSVDIQCVQSGSGTPSPDHIRAISGCTGVFIACKGTGKNLYPVLLTEETYRDGQGRITKNSDGTITLRQTASGVGTYGYGSLRSVPRTIPADMPLTFSFTAYTNYTGDSPKLGLTFQFDYIATKQFTLTNTPTRYSMPIGPSRNVNNFAIVSYTSGIDFSGVEIYVSDAMFEIGESASEYEPYNGQAVTVELKDGNNNSLTVYGGRLEIDCGANSASCILTVTHGYIASYAGETLPGAWISDRDVYAAGSTPTSGAQVVYELDSADYQTYPLTVPQLATLSGLNYIAAMMYAVADRSSATAPVTVEYRADPALTLGAENNN